MFHLRKMKKLFLIISFSSFLYSDTDWNDPNNCSLPDNNYLIESILNNMTLEQKVGQIIMPEINSITPDDAKKYQFGTILNGGGGFPNKNKNNPSNLRLETSFFIGILQKLMQKLELWKGRNGAYRAPFGTKI